jgi:hypothetical protein
MRSLKATTFLIVSTDQFDLRAAPGTEGNRTHHRFVESRISQLHAPQHCTFEPGFLLPDSHRTVKITTPIETDLLGESETSTESLTPLRYSHHVTVERRSRSSNLAQMVMSDLSWYCRTNRRGQS